MTRLGFDSQLHKRILTQIILDVFKEFNNKLAFKGGSCAFLFYDLPRLSLDLDFDVVGNWTQEDTDKLKAILVRYGKIKDFYDKRFTLFLLLDYQAGTPNIKIELNKRIWQNNQYKTIWFLGVPMKITEPETLLTNKIIALTNRKQTVARDLFDIYYFLKMGFVLNPKLIKERTGKNVNEYLKSLPSFIRKHYTAKNVLQGLGEVLDNQQKQWVKKDLIKEVIKEIEKIKT